MLPPDTGVFDFSQVHTFIIRHKCANNHAVLCCGISVRWRIVFIRHSIERFGCIVFVNAKVKLFI